MAIVVPRIAYTNLVAAAATVLTDSSEQAGNPKTWLKDPLRSKVLRFARGWTISTGFNDKIDFNRAGVKVATIAAATYATPTDLCTAIVAALEAADAPPVWACSYSTSTFKFTISSDLAFILLFSSGVNPTATPALDLGFPLTDTTNAVSQVATNASYQTRHWVKADLVTAQAVTAGIVINHNSGAGGTWTLQGNATDVWTGPTVNQALSGDTNVRLAYIATQTLRYWRLVVNDVQNSAAYGELGVWFVGTYYQPPAYSPSFVATSFDLSVLSLGTFGASWLDERTQGATYGLSWRNIPDADKVSFQTFQAAIPTGKSFFVTLDTADLTTTKYVASSAAMAFNYVQDGLLIWNTALNLVESLG